VLKHNSLRWELFAMVFYYIKRHKTKLWFNRKLSAVILKDKPCKRLLKYIGCVWCKEEYKDDDPFFKIGNVYESESFNGATYRIKDYPRRIGCCYFERLT